MFGGFEMFGLGFGVLGGWAPGLYTFDIKLKGLGPRFKGALVNPAVKFTCHACL